MIRAVRQLIAVAFVTASLIALFIAITPAPRWP